MRLVLLHGAGSFLQKSQLHCWAQVQRCQVSASAHQQPSVNAAAISLSVPVEQLSDSERQQVAHQYGYSKIGKKLPEGVTLSQIVKSMPSEVILHHMFSVYG